jgi:hypothetical protein
MSSSSKPAGKIRHKLAELLCQLTGGLVEAHEIQRSNPIHQHYADCCAWDCWVALPAQPGAPARRIHVYSWDKMRDCVRYGIVKVGLHREASDYEVSANEQ